MLEAVSKTFEPSHNGLLLPAIGGAGMGLTMTAVLPAALVQPFPVAVTEYDPAADAVMLVKDGF
jgi:hypothetical protein